jgi:succinate dehydrogenase / fumarate reductase cytochrome b subunit
MLGPYYKFQLTSLLSITSRICGVFITVISAPLALCWLIAVASGPEAYARLASGMDNIIGQLILLATVFCLCFHFMNGIRHLLWDTGAMLEIRDVYISGWVMIVCALGLSALVVGMAI